MSPVLDINPYDIDVLRDPYGYHEALREMHRKWEATAKGPLAAVAVSKQLVDG